MNYNAASLLWPLISPPVLPEPSSYCPSLMAQLDAIERLSSASSNTVAPEHEHKISTQRHSRRRAAKFRPTADHEVPSGASAPVVMSKLLPSHLLKAIVDEELVKFGDRKRLSNIYDPTAEVPSGASAPVVLSKLLSCHLLKAIVDEELAKIEVRKRLSDIHEMVKNTVHAVKPTECGSAGEFYGRSHERC
eukprot:Opistho-2@26837